MLLNFTLIKGGEKTVKIKGFRKIVLGFNINYISLANFDSVVVSNFLNFEFKFMDICRHTTSKKIA